LFKEDKQIKQVKIANVENKKSSINVKELNAREDKFVINAFR